MNETLEIMKLLFDWTAAIAWPAVTLVIVLLVRKPIVKLLARVDTVAQRAETEAFDLQLGEKLKLSFRKALESANPTTVEEAVEAAEQAADKALSIFNLLGNIPLKQHHKDLLLKIAKGGDEGINWEYGGKPEDAPGRTMGHLLTYSLVSRDGDRYFAHPLVREYIFTVHGQPSSKA